MYVIYYIGSYVWDDAPTKKIPTKIDLMKNIKQEIELK